MHQVDEWRLVHCANQTHTKSIPSTSSVWSPTAVQGTRARCAKRYGPPKLLLRPVPRNKPCRKGLLLYVKQSAHQKNQRAPGRGGFVGIGPVHRSTVNPPPFPSVA